MSEVTRKIDDFNTEAARILKTINASTGAVFNDVFGEVIDSTVQNEFKVWNVLPKVDYTGRADQTGYRIHTARSAVSDSCADGADFDATPGNQTYVEVAIPYRTIKTDFAVTVLAKALSQGGDSIPRIWDEEAMRATDDHMDTIEQQLFGKEGSPDPVAGNDVYDLGLMVDSSDVAAGSGPYGYARTSSSATEYLDTPCELENSGTLRDVTRKLIRQGRTLIEKALRMPDVIVTSHDIRDSIEETWFPSVRDVPSQTFRGNFKMTEIDNMAIMPCRHIYDRLQAGANYDDVAYLLNSRSIEVRYIRPTGSSQMVNMMTKDAGLTSQAFIYNMMQLGINNFRAHGKIGDLQ